MIEIKITINEKEDGSVLVHTKSCSVGTTKEMAHAIVIVKAAETACKILIEHTGGKQKMLRSFHKIAPIGDG